MPRSYCFRLFTVPLVVTAALVATGCGNDRTATSSSPASTSPAVASATATPLGTPNAGTSAMAACPPQTGPDTFATAATLIDGPAGLKYADLRPGCGATAKTGSTVNVEYTGWLTNGTQFDSSRGRQPFSFTIGSHQVIDGWDKGVLGMKAGGKRRLVLPPALGYGAGGQGPIPPNSSLVFDVELLSVG